MTTMTMTATTEMKATAMTEQDSGLRRWRVRFSARARIVGWCVLLLAFAVGASVLLLRQILHDRLDDQVEASLEQEVAELRALADGRDPATGQPFAGNVPAIFDTFLSRNIPTEGEALFSFVGGAPYKVSPGAPYALEREPELVSRWSGLTATDTGTFDTPVGPTRFLAVPLQQGGETTGVFVVANFVAGQRAEVDDAIRTAAGVSAAVLVVASLLAWVVAGRVLAPVKTLTDTARAITESDLTGRIPVQGNDQIAELTETFNAMLDRLEATIIRGHLELLGDDPDERREVQAIVTDELDRMSRQVDDMLLLAKAERPGFLDREPIDIGPATEEWLAKMATLGDRDWRIDAKASGIVVADRQRLTQAVMNLAENAARHTDPGGEIAVGSELADDQLRIWVRDDGPGIHPDDQERIFERFARGSTGISRSQSSGLGLAIVRAIAEAHHGRAELVSEPGRGARFTIVIPVDGGTGGPDPWRAS
jgi:two-component system OmpR family sensor kinase